MTLIKFLEKLLDYHRKDPEGLLSSFFDYELLQLYKHVTKDFFYSHPETDRPHLAQLEALQEIGEHNSLIKHWIGLNFYFDHTYLLNLDRRPDRLTHSTGSLQRVGWFNWSRFSAVDGGAPDSIEQKEWEAYFASETSQRDQAKYHRKAIETAGSWAILKSMYLMIKDAQRRGYRRILVLQDDLLFHKRFLEKFLKLIDHKQTKVPTNWKLLYLGATQYNWSQIMKRDGASYYFPMGTADGAFAVGIDSSVFQEILDEIVRFDAPFDTGALSTIQARYAKQCLVMKPNLIIADIRDSDLREGYDLKDHARKLKWDPKLYRLKWETTF